MTAITIFGTNRKPHSNLHAILHRFPAIADYWSNIRCRQGMDACV